MKTMVILALTALLAVTTGGAEVITKGGASALLKTTAVRADAPVRAPMACPKCTSTFAKVAAPVSKGTTPQSVLVERHACASCGTKWVTTGHGKAKVEAASHTCGGCKS